MNKKEFDSKLDEIRKNNNFKLKDFEGLLKEFDETSNIDEKLNGEKSKEDIKSLMEETTFLVSKTALYPFEDEESKNESNYLKKFLEYKIDINPLFKGMDCDVNLYSIVMYCLLENKENLDLDKIEKQGDKENIKKYQINKENIIYRGDTLTSALSLINRYCAILKNEITYHPKKYYDLKYQMFGNLFFIPSKNKKSCIPFEFKDFENYCHYKDNSDIIWNAFDKAIKEYLRVYQMFGNYMCIPGKHYKGGSFNTIRSHKAQINTDTVDFLLLYLYGYMKNKEEKYDEYLNMLLGVNNENVIKDTKTWLDAYDDWCDFIEKNCLTAFVSSKKDGYVPISLKTGYPIENIEEYKDKWYKPMPDSLEEFNTFFEQLSKRIVWRTIDIYKKVRE